MRGTRCRERVGRACYLSRVSRLVHAVCGLVCGVCVGVRTSVCDGRAMHGAIYWQLSIASFLTTIPVYIPFACYIQSLKYA